MPMMPLAVVIGLAQNGLGVVRALGRSGVRTIAISADPDDAFARTRYASRVVHADVTSEALLDALWDIGRGLDMKGVLIPTTDRSVLTLSAGRRQLEPFFSHSLPDAVVVDRLMNKKETARYAAAHGFNVPRTWDVSSAIDLRRQADAMTFPCILKPQVKSVAFARHAPQKAFRIQSFRQLQDTYDRIAEWTPDVVVQEWIDGPDTALIFSLYYFDAHGVPVASFTGRKLRQFIPYCGTACSAEPFDDGYVHDAGVRFFQACRYRGFGAIEFKRSPDGQYYLMEPTVGRTEHLFALAAANGVNLPLVGYRDMAGLPPHPQSLSHRPVRYVDWRRDWKAALFYHRRGELTLTGWMRTLSRAREHAFFAWDDPAPWVHRLKGRAGRGVRRIGRRIPRIAPRRSRRGARRFATTSARQLPRPKSALRPNDEHLAAALAWLAAAQDAVGGGVSRGFSAGRRHGRGWQPAYPETTGYIIPTMFDCAERYPGQAWRARAIRMADWLLTIQYPSGGLTGGIDGQNLPPVVFNTGMVLHGWCRAYAETGDGRYLAAMRRAVSFLIEAQDEDGGWRRFTTSRSEPHVHAYDVLVSWALLQAAEHLQDHRPRGAARRNLEFTLRLQQHNGWFRSNGLRPKKHGRPLTHTIGYAVQGLLECGVREGEPRYVEHARLAADALLARLAPAGYLAGEFDSEWRPAADWCCLTGTAQMSVVWLRLFELTGDEQYVAAAVRANEYLKATQILTGVPSDGLYGGIAGSYPFAGGYGRRQMLNWATKYFVDALLAEERCARLKAVAPGAAAGVVRV